MLRNKVTHCGNDSAPDRAAKKVRLSNGFNMNLLHHEGGTTSDSSMHAKLMSLCQNDIQAKQPKEQIYTPAYLQTQVAKMSTQEKSQLLQNALNASANASNVAVSSLINDAIANQVRSLYLMNIANMTMASASQQEIPIRLPQGNNNHRIPLKLQDCSVNHTDMRNYIGTLVSLPGNTVYHRSVITPSVPHNMIPYLLSSSLNQSATITTIRNNLYGVGNMNANSMQGERSIPCQLPVCLAQPADRNILSEHQQFLRFQIEVFEATEADVRTHVRGRNKPIVLGQVGIRCRHCAHLSASRRQKGSTYFPASTIGLYQAAQNMCTAHIQCGLCSQTPDYIKEHFKGLLANKTFTSGAGKPYWSKSAQAMGLVDTENGIFFIRNVQCL